MEGSAYLSLIEADTEVMFLPQQPLLTSGSLSEQVRQRQNRTVHDCLFVQIMFSVVHIHVLWSNFVGVNG